KKGWGKWFSITCGIVALLLATVPLTWSAATRNAESEVKRIAREGGLPLSLADLYPKYNGDPVDNAATYWTRLRDGDDWMKRVKKEPFEVAPGVAPPVAYRKQINDYESYYAVAERAAACSTWSPTRTGDPTTLNFPEYGPMRDAVTRLEYRSRLRTFDGDTEGALEDIRCSFKLANFMGKDPTLIGSMVKDAMVSMGYRACLDLLVPASKNPALAKELVSAMDMVEPMNFAHVLEGEAFFAVWASTHRFGPEMLGGSENSDSRREAAKAEASRYFWGPKVVQAWSDVLREVRKAPSDPSIAASAMAKSLEPLTKTDDPRLLGVNIFLPVFSGYFRSVKRPRATKGMIDIALAALQTNSPPNVQGSHDPFSDKPFHVLATEKGWKLYSVGLDGTDDKAATNIRGPKVDLVMEFDGQQITLKGS
ncbi:MAG: hypothetical protein ABUL72_01560, partial [Armatimonadota bacterium]